MKHLHFDIEKDGFYGAYWKCKNNSDAGVIAMLGDDPEDYLAKKCVKWLNNLGFNVLTMSPVNKDSPSIGHSLHPSLLPCAKPCQMKSLGVKAIVKEISEK